MSMYTENAEFTEMYAQDYLFDETVAVKSDGIYFIEPSNDRMDCPQVICQPIDAL